MTRPGWMAEAALGALLAPGVTLVVADPMDLPLVALRPDLRIVTPSGMLILRPGMDGVAVLRTAPPDAAEACGPVLAVGATAEAADAMAMACLGRPADGCFDGTRLTAGGDAGRSWADGLASLHGHDPLALLDRAAAAAPGIVGTGVTTGGDALLWFDPVCCLRPASMPEACRRAVDREMTAPPFGPVRLHLPHAGRGTVRLSFRGPAPALPAGAAVTRIDDRTVEIGPGGSDRVAAAIRIRGPRGRIERIGVVLPFPGDPAAAEFDDPLDVYADPAFAGPG